MAPVSILIPAFKPDYLGRALISAQQQTFEDIEILVGDDTPDGALEEIVRRIDDPRIQYLHHGFGDGTRNAQQLWERASGKYIKWLFDDDLLMPTSVAVLANALGEHPESALAFHGRVFIDSNDVVTFVPPALLKPGERGLIDRKFLVEQLLGQVHNFIGEPSNVMLRRDLVDAASFLDYGGLKLDFLADVAMFLNLAERG